ncbi:DMT family transporter [Thermus thalpophilus]|uniref:DMT family transporter n=1 Tax=Thermus thalpophilus TaxID=2908147 RepID=UPI001FAAF960|nr:DMT family transporter [Thermus thalpophilus]
MTWIYYVVVLLAGAMLPIQAGVNARLAQVLEHPVRSALVSFGVGTVALFGLAWLLAGPNWPWGKALGAPGWVYVGGLLGPFYVVASIIFAPKLGALLTFALVITGQLLASLFLDHFGLLYPRHEINPMRILGVALLILGMLLIRRY